MESSESDKLNKFVKAEMEIVDEIIKDETWYEGERRQEPVDENDPKIRSKVVRIINQHAEAIVKEARRRSKIDR